MTGSEHLEPSRTPYILRDPRPGDYGWMVSVHGELYAREYGWDALNSGYARQLGIDESQVW